MDDDHIDNGDHGDRAVVMMIIRLWDVASAWFRSLPTTDGAVVLSVA